MAVRLIFTSLFLALAFPSAWPASQRRDLTLPPFETPDITKFIGIPQPIWTYYSTEPSNVSCKVDVMVNMSRSGIFFNRSYKYPAGERTTVKSTTLLNGAFVNSVNNMYLLVPGSYEKFFHISKFIRLWFWKYRLQM
ncbi:hypothetical protein V5799_000208 [Amblyomma americanum]|uniref:Lipocalin n=1 Tax=Amblyomma americanum TaxID=6943 RepID=A0AAQ4D3Q0_AMBAM